MSTVITPAVVRGASRGFTVLLLGGVVQPWIGVLYRPLGYIWLLIVAVAAFAFAARTTASSEPAVVKGCVAAFGSYVLVLPLVASAGALEPTQAVLTSLLSVVVGGLSSFFAGAGQRRRDHAPQVVSSS